MRRTAKQSVVVHNGKLHWAALFHALPKNLLTPSMATREDPLALGWGVRRRRRSLRLSLNGVLYATAESVVALATISEKLRSSSKGAFQVSVDAGPKNWIESLGLTQLTSGVWTPPSDIWTRPFDCFAHPLKKLTLQGKRDIEAHTADLVGAIRLLPEEVLGDDRDGVLASIERVAHETLLNIWEHAYSDSQSKALLLCATVTPSRYFEESSTVTRTLTSSQEGAWLSENRQSLVLEIAIGDVGHGIPQTLWRNAKDRRRRFTNDWRQEVLGQRQRALAHQDLCSYAFHYDSSRKRQEEFASLASRLSWRGLHRCLMQTEYLSGSIVLASGQGRAGYAVVQDKLVVVAPTEGARADLPGTLVVLRFPTRRKARKWAGVGSTAGRVQVTVGHFASEVDLQEGLAGEELTHALVSQDRHIPDRPLNRGSQKPDRTRPRDLRVVAACVSFRRFARVGELVGLLHRLPPNHLTIVLFADVPEEVRIELRAYTRLDSASIGGGTPRLLCLWDPERRSLLWQIAGEVPDSQFGQSVCATLETIGHAELGGLSTSAQALARDLANTYPDYLVWDESRKSVGLAHAEIDLSVEDHAEALNVAFKCFMDGSSGKSFVFSCQVGEAIRIPTGRMVKRFLSVLPMLQDSRVLAAALGDRLFRVLETLGNPAEMCLVTDSPASYFVATMLLRGRARGPKVRILDSGALERPVGVIVLFVDVVFRGETVRRIAKTLDGWEGWSRSAVVGVDLRRAPTPTLLGTDYSVHSLVKYQMDPQEVEPMEAPVRILEVDSITHAPVSRPCEFTGLGTTEERETFLQETRGLFRVGFHRLSDGQIHTLSLDTEVLVRVHGEFISEQLLKEIKEFLLEIRTRRTKVDCVLFCRPESRVHALLPRIAEQLSRSTRNVRAVFVANLSVAPTSPRAIFPREVNNLLADVHAEGGQRLLFPPELDREFVGIYLDDASITGRSLQDFIAKATGLKKPRPVGLLAIVVVNRLSPREVRFLDVCRDLNAEVGRKSARHQESVPFRFRSLFRLQVKGTSESETGHAPDVIRQLRESAEFFDERLKDYVEAVWGRVQRVVGRAAVGSEPRGVVLHPFYPHESEEVRLDSRVVRVRHLLALNKQNEGVVSEVLREITRLTKNAEAGLLSMFALEPGLLEDEPISTACWPEIEGLCLWVLAESQTAAVRSDALAVLCRRPEELLATLEQILPLIAPDEELVSQAAAYLLSFSRRDRTWSMRVRKSFDDVGGRVDRQTMTWLRTVLDVPERVESIYVVRDEVDAIARVRSLVAATWTHVGGLDDWQAFDTKAKALESEPLDVGGVQLGTHCLRFAESVLLPGLAGIRALGMRRLRPRDANRIWGAFIEANRKVSEIRSMLESGADGVVGADGRLREAWNQLRRATIKAASPVRTLGRAEQISSEVSVIEEYLPRLFASPFQLVQEMAKKHVPDLRMDSGDAIFDEGAVLVPVARSVVVDFFRILLENMAKYAQPRDRVCRWVLFDDRNETKLRVECSDVKRLDAVGGEGTGVPLLMELARKGGFGFERNERDGEYVSRMTFGNVLRVYPEVQRS